MVLHLLVMEHGWAVINSAPGAIADIVGETWLCCDLLLNFAAAAAAIGETRFGM